MPVLSNAKHELFAQEIAKGKTADEAQVISGIELKTCESLNRYYVYVLIDPRDDRVFYVGKGKGRRAYCHEQEWISGVVVNAQKFERIAQIRNAGQSVKCRCLADGLNEDDALDTERWLIDAIGIENLTNLSRGEQSEHSKVAAMLRDHVSRIRPFCRWKERILPQLKNTGMSVERHEQLYWDLTGKLVEQLAVADGRPIRRYPMMYQNVA